MTEENKRKRTGDDFSGRSAKRKQGYNQWRAKNGSAGHANAPTGRAPATIESGDAGIFLTFEKGKESKCVAEAKDLLGQYAEKLYVDQFNRTATDETTLDEVDGGDIEAKIKNEIEELKPAADPKKNLVYYVRLEVPCVAFIKVAEPLDPVKLVHEICADAVRNPEQKASRFIQRMTPMTMMKKTLNSGLEELSEEVLKPHFHSGGPSKKFAIRPTIRSHNTWSRDTIIKLVADAVGAGHAVDLKNYDLLILVDVYRNVCGMSVVASDYDQLKRYNLAEIYNPTPKDSGKPKMEGPEGGHPSGSEPQSG